MGNVVEPIYKKIMYTLIVFVYKGYINNMYFYVQQSVE